MFVTLKQPVMKKNHNSYSDLLFFPWQSLKYRRNYNKKSMQAIKEKIPVPKETVPVTTLYLFFFLSLNIKSNPVIVAIRKFIKKTIGKIYIYFPHFYGFFSTNLLR